MANTLKKIFSPDIFIWFYPLLLIIPNIALDFTESYSILAKISNVLFPLGIYCLVMSLWKNVGRTGALILFFALFYGAFQVVLLFLYGESIIAIDMLLNVATTNVEEASELLINLASAVITICVLYVPSLIWGIILAVKKIFPNKKKRLILRKTGLWLTVAGVLTIVAGYIFVEGFNISKEIFPINVMRNTSIAIKRTVATENYHNTSASFSYNASSTHPADEKEIYMIVVGETSRADNWQILGYNRPTTPLLSKREDIVAFPKVLSESNTTHKSVPMLLTWLSADIFNDSIYTTKSIVTAFKEAGFSTAYFSNQGRNHSFIDFFANEADTTVFLKDDGNNHYDAELIELVGRYLKTGNNKQFLVLHTYGSHFNYVDRYPADASVFHPDYVPLAEAKNRDQLINAYNNTIVGTDKLLNNLADILEAENATSAMLYVSDHGEDIFDDERERFLHASPVPTYYQVHVPMVAWMSSKYNDEYPEMFNAAQSNKDKDISSSASLFNTMMDMAGIKSNYADKSKSLVSHCYKTPARVYLNDYNEQVNLKRAGLRETDFEQLRKHGISDK